MGGTVTGILANAKGSFHWEKGMVASSTLKGQVPGSQTTLDAYEGVNGSITYRDTFIGPGEYLTVRVATSTPGSFVAGSLQGTCSAVFEEIQ